MQSRRTGQARAQTLKPSHRRHGHVKAGAIHIVGRRKGSHVFDIYEKRVIHTERQGKIRINELVPGVDCLLSELEQR